MEDMSQNEDTIQAIAEVNCAGMCITEDLEFQQPNIKRCFIENDFVIDDDVKSGIEQKFHFATGIEEKYIDFDKIFQKQITNAFVNSADTWHAIVESDEIYISTGFRGDSAYLLESMCELALKKKIKNKTIINFRDNDSHLTMTERGSRLLQILMAKNNIKYTSQDSAEFIEIAKKIKF